MRNRQSMGHGDRVCSIGPAETRRRIIAGTLGVRESPEYRAVMAAYRDISVNGAIPEDVRQRMEMIERSGPTVVRWVVDQHGRLMMDYREWDAVHALVRAEGARFRLLDEICRNCLVRVVQSREDARRQIRQLHLRGSIGGRQDDRIIADQLKDFRRIFDQNWPELKKSHPQINGPFYLSLEFASQLVGVSMKRVEQVIASEADFEDLLHLDVMQRDGSIQSRRSRHEVKAGGPAESRSRVEEDLIGEEGLGVARGDDVAEHDGACLAAPMGCETGRDERRVGPEQRQDDPAWLDDPLQDPIYGLGWELYGIIRDLGWDRDRGGAADEFIRGEVAARGSMTGWFVRVQSYLRTIGPLAERKSAYQRILFIAIQAVLCQRLMIDDGLGGFFNLAGALLDRLQGDYPIWFDRIEPWVIWQAADWWRYARSAVYHIPRPDGTVHVQGRDDHPDTDPEALTLGSLPWVSRVDQDRYRSQAPRSLRVLLDGEERDDPRPERRAGAEDGGPGEHPTERPRPGSEVPAFFRTRSREVMAVSTSR